MSKEKRLGR